MAAPATVTTNGSVAAEVTVGTSQKLIFRETSDQLASYDGHHVAIYISDFSGPHRKMVERGIVSEESNPYQYRFVEIVDPESGKTLFEIGSITKVFTGLLLALEVTKGSMKLESSSETGCSTRRTLLKRWHLGT